MQALIGTQELANLLAEMCNKGDRCPLVHLNVSDSGIEPFPLISSLRLAASDSLEYLNLGSNKYIYQSFSFSYCVFSDKSLLSLGLINQVLNLWLYFLKLLNACRLSIFRTVNCQLRQ